MRANLLENGHFDGNLDEWAGTGSINRALGYPRLGCVQLDAGESLSQAESLSADVLYTLHYFYRLADGATLTVSYGDVEQTHSGAPSDAWREGVLVFALDADGTDSVTFAASGGVVYVDGVTLVWGALPLTRAAVAEQVADRLSELASDASLSSTATGDKPEGDYTAAIDEALRAVGAVDGYGSPDVTQVLLSKTNDLVESAQMAVLQRLRSRYALKTDVSLGPRRESYSQIAKSIDEMLSGAGADRRVKMATMHRRNGWRR